MTQAAVDEAKKKHAEKLKKFVEHKGAKKGGKKE